MGTDHAIGRCRGGLSTKINALIDGLKPARALVADRGYDGRAVIDLITARGGCAHVPTQRDRKVQRSIDSAIYRRRNARRAVLL